MAEDQDVDVEVLVQTILIAISENNAELVEDLLWKQGGREYVSLLVDESGRTGLHVAAENGNLQIVDSLLLAGMPWNAVDHQYITAGELAHKNNHQDVYETLLQAGIRAELLLQVMEDHEDADGIDGFHSEEDEEIEFNELGEPIGFVSKPKKAISNEESSSSNFQESSQPTEHTQYSSSTKASNLDYLNSKLTYSEDGTRLVDAEQNGVMMEWELPLMKLHAKHLCEKFVGNSAVEENSSSSSSVATKSKPQIEFSILNVGFGLGLIDTEIQTYKPTKHVIIEAHPDVLMEMKKRGWHEKPGVEILEGRWQDLLLAGKLDAYDAIFWDTFGEHYKDQKKFHEAIPYLLNPGGVYSFFNGLGGTNPFFHDVYCKIVELEFHDLGLNVQYVSVPMDTSSIHNAKEQVWKGIKRCYFNLPFYNLPIITFSDADYSAAPVDDYE